MCGQKSVFILILPHFSPNKHSAGYINYKLFIVWQRLHFAYLPLITYTFLLISEYPGWFGLPENGQATCVPSSYVASIWRLALCVSPSEFSYFSCITYTSYLGISCLAIYLHSFIHLPRREIYIHIIQKDIPYHLLFLSGKTRKFKFNRVQLHITKVNKQKTMVNHIYSINIWKIKENILSFILSFLV